MKYLVYNLFFFFLLISCNSSEEKTAITKNIKIDKTISLEKLDSIHINYLGIQTVHDLDSKFRKVIFMEHRESFQEIIVANFEGDILASFSKWGDVPDSYGNLMAPLTIDGDSSFVAYGSRGFLTYDFTGRLKSRVKHAGFQYKGFNRIGMGYGMEELGNSYLYWNQGQPSVEYSNLRYYKELRLLTWLDPETGENEPFIQFPENSIFRSGKYFFRDAWAPAFTLTDELIYVVFGIEPVIYIYETSPPYSLVSSIPLDLADYRYFKGADSYSSDVRFFGQQRVSGRILNIKRINGYFMVAYFPGFDAFDTEEQFANKSPEEAVIFTNKMQEKYLHRIAILDSLGNKLSDFVPEGLIASSMTVRDNELWMLEKADPETEKEYFRLFRVELKLD